ncbi:MAG TPA: hydroxysqualene dehydroxylase HpnE [Burkholderiaceae bacterium]
MKLAVIGGGWAGLAAAVQATAAGHQATVFEASRDWGGRARTLHADRTLDNGQHILLGAYAATLALMQQVGVDPAACLLRTPLDLRLPNGHGLRLPRLPAPWDAALGIAAARGWSVRDKWHLLRITDRWRRAGFSCAPETTVSRLCQDVSDPVYRTLMAPLCLAALNTSPERASARVFLRVLHDALLGAPGSSHMLLPAVGLGALFPEPALAWLQTRGATVQAGARVTALARTAGCWNIGGAAFDHVILACPPTEAARLVAEALPLLPVAAQPPAGNWLARTRALRFEAITTVYLQTAGTRLARPLLALDSDSERPAQFVFDRGQLGGPAGLLALVASASHGPADLLEQQARHQARQQLGVTDVHSARTITEKRATFACTAGLERPPVHIAPGLSACGDYVDGPYPATLEGAVRSAHSAVAQIGCA